MTKFPTAIPLGFTNSLQNCQISSLDKREVYSHVHIIIIISISLDQVLTTGSCSPFTHQIPCVSCTSGDITDGQKEVKITMVDTSVHEST